MCGLLLLVGFLTCARPNRAEAGITNDLTVINDTDEQLGLYVNGFFMGYVDAGGTLTVHVGDPSNAASRLRVEDGFTNIVARLTVPENENNFTWVVE